MNFEQQRRQFQEAIRGVESKKFTELALAVFRWQAEHNPVYAKYLSLLQIKPESISDLNAIPCLPISLFKNHTIKTGQWTAETVFSSSGTTGQLPSQHEVRSIDWYKENTVRGFKLFYGDPADFCFLALLPSYLERTGSSLVLMAEHFIQRSQYNESGFFLDDFAALAQRIKKLKKEGIPTVLLGVTFGLLDFEEQHQIPFENLIIMETGGMKGRRKEMTRIELHQQLQPAFNVKLIHSEYGMTELFSQAYSKRDGRFFAANTMKILIRDVTDPFTMLRPERHGAINIIDLANLDTCCFIATDDLGISHKDNTFEVLGRLDGSEMRGCNLMLSQG
jgi:phenylacetate-coenzyme A ligase PaaK-like adenylate-forming protein